jgi:hypothetical protein
MKALSSRLQFALVVAGYAGVLVLSAGLVFARYLQELRYPVDASSAMWGFGDWMLAAFIACMLLVPTFLLAFFVRTSETASTRYSRAVLGVSLTAPISVGIMFIPAISQGSSLLGWFCMYRLLVSPVVVMGLVISRLLARFSGAKRLGSYSLLVEIGTLALIMVSLFLGGSHLLAQR